ncbi:pilus assembly protein [Epibacterium sp. DP7N7-1]|nr:pilus assembly protein [Epibacterium sp. DP7N7-1]
MIKFFKNFRNDESGAVTVDWVVLTAAVAVLGTLVYTQIETGIETATSNTGTFLTDNGSTSYTD